MKYKIGQRVKVKDASWYNSHKDHCDNVYIDGTIMTKDMAKHCGKCITITRVLSDCYAIMEDEEFWTDGMIEGLSDARDIPVEHPCDWLKRGLNLPDGYEFQDENGDVINTKKITLVKKKSKYPTTYEECCKVLNYCYNPFSVKTAHREELIRKFQFLLLARDAYWKIAGKEMGLGKSWKPDWSVSADIKYVIEVYRNNVRTNSQGYFNILLAFPTSEIRNAFYENFKELIESCKELL